MEAGTKEFQQHGQEGSGSAENIGKDREEQKKTQTTIDDKEREDIAEQIGLKPQDIGDVQQTGGLSGRDDLAGGSGDRMENASGNDETERF